MLSYFEKMTSYMQRDFIVTCILFSQLVLYRELLEGKITTNAPGNHAYSFI